MKKALFHETEKRGTPHFPVSFYHVDESHPRYQMRTQWHSDTELDRVLEGSLTVTLGNQTYEMKKGDSLLIPGGVIHGAEAKNCVYECMVFAPTVLYSTLQHRTVVKRKLNKPVFFTDNQTVNRIFEGLKTAEDGYEFQVVGDLYNLVYDAISRQKSTIADTTDYRIDQIKTAISFIEENYPRTITLASLSAACSLSPNYFCRFFKEVTGQTPVEYITAYRVEAACEMLLAGASVTDTALTCGFNDLSYFINVFKKHMGISPKQYAGLYKDKKL